MTFGRLLLAALLVSGCAGLGSVTAPPAPSAARPIATPNALRTPGPFTDPGPIGVTEMAVVTFVIDGDTVRVKKNGDEFNEYTVRYIGMDAPERESEPLWEESADANEALVLGREVFLEPDVSDTDRHGRLLRHVWIPLDGRWVNANAEIVRLGLAEARSYPPDVLWDAIYAAAESEARAADRGIWSPR